MRNRGGARSIDSELVTYLTFDSVASGVGRSQVLPYLEGLADRGVRLRLVSFETSESDVAQSRLLNAGIIWASLSFGKPGLFGGIRRTFAAMRAVRGSAIVHARSDLPAFAALLARCPYVLWDCRAFWTDQRIAMGSLRKRSPVTFIIRRIEGLLAKKAGHINVLTTSGKSRLMQKYGVEVGQKISVISTCVDVEKFQFSSLPSTEKLQILLSGSLNDLYDLPRMMDIFEQIARMVPAKLVVATNDVSRWKEASLAQDLTIGNWDHDEMPGLIRSCHVGLSVCVDRSGDSLTATMPTKIAEFLASGRPVVVNSGLIDAALLVEGYQCGVVANPSENSELVARRVIDLLSKDGLSRSCRIAAEENFSIAGAVDQLASIYSAAMKGLREERVYS